VGVEGGAPGPRALGPPKKRPAAAALSPPPPLATSGLLTIAVGAMLPWWIDDTIADAAWLAPADKEVASSTLAAAAAAVGAPPPFPGPGRPPPDTLADCVRAAGAALRVWQLWALAAAIALVQVSFFGVLFFAPLELASAFGSVPVTYQGPKEEASKAVGAALKSAVVFAPSAVALVAASLVTRATGDRVWTCTVCLVLSAASFAALGAVGGRTPGAGLALLTCGSVGGCAVLAPLATWPHAYLPHGAPVAMSYSAWNQVCGGWWRGGVGDAAAASLAEAAAGGGCGGGARRSPTPDAPFSLPPQWVALSGIVGPYLLGALPRAPAFYALAGCQAAAGLLLLAFGLHEKRAARRVRAGTSL